MPHIVVDSGQAETIVKFGRNVQVRDPNGKIVGFIEPAPSDEEIALAKARLAKGPNGPTYTTQEVLDHLRTLKDELIVHRRHRFGAF